ncbi:MAG: energy transducer TonB [Chthoniobacterales bacterium]
MAGPLLYKPAPKWQVFAAFGGAFAIHAVAVGIAALRPEEPVVDLSAIPEAVVEISLEQQAAPPEPTPPPEEEPEPVEAPPEPQERPEFEEEKPTPKPKTDKPKPVAPIARPTSAAPTGPAPTGKAAMIFKPNIAYPYEAKRSRTTGSGVVLVTVSPSGTVTSCSMGKSTGSPILDNAATSAFRSARFKPGTVPKVQIPITFTLTGAQY